MRRPFAVPLLMSSALGASFIAWTWLALGTGVLSAWDASVLTPGVSLQTGWGQVTAALSFVFNPWVVYPVLLVLAGWAWRRRLRNLAWALLLAAPLGASSSIILKTQFGRPRPPTAIDLVTTGGWAYPSGHMTAITTFIVLVVATATVARRSRTTVWVMRVGAVLVWGLVAYNRWALRAHYPTDIVAGTLWGGFIASLSLALGGVHVVAPWAGRPSRQGVPPSVAVIVNPTKVPDWEILRRHVAGSARAHGWGRPRWFETREDDPGLGAARVAVQAGAELVLVAGGDGTVRSVCEGLAGTGVALAVLPAGTGNLLARNLSIPLDSDDALDIAFDGVPLPIDLMEVRADGGEPQTSVVMAGMGVDAVIMGETSADLKRAVGPAAYVVTALSALSRRPFHVEVTVDDDEPLVRDAGLALVANVGQLFGGLQLIPDAHPDDGLVDLLLVSADSPAGWASVAGRMLSGAADTTGLERARGTRVVIETAEPVPYQLDGDTAGECRHFEASVVPRALTVMVPR